MKTIRYIYLTVLAVLLSSVMALAQTVEVKGVVTDEVGQPLPGAGIIDKQNARNGVVTDLDGKFAIKVAGNGILEISCLGFNTILEEVKGRTRIDITMVPDTKELDEVVVVAYGTAKKSDLTGSVAVVDMRDVENASATSIGSALQGRIAGVDISSNTGEPGESGSIQIRGSRSISAGNEPLIVVDGVLDAVSDLSELNPSDIKSISVLKDVSSTSLYGARGANGVILVTTEDRAKQEGRVSVNLKASAGFSQIAGTLDVMNATEFAQWCNDVKYFSSSMQGKPLNESNFYYTDPTVFGKGTDWVKELSRTGVYQDYNLSVRYSTPKTDFNASVGYNDTQGVVTGSGFSRLTGRMSAKVQPFKWLTLGVRVNFSDRQTDKTNAAISGTNVNAAIFISPLLGIGDTWNYFGSEVSSGGSPFNNPYISARDITNELSQRTLNLVPWLRLTFNRYTEFNTKLSYIDFDSDTFYYSPSTMPIAQRNRTGGTATTSYYHKTTLLSESTFNYRRTFNRIHSLEAMAGVTGERRVIDYHYFRGTGYMDDNVTHKNLAGLIDPRSQTNTSYETIVTTLSFIARVNYDYRKRYYFTLTGRADSASKFSEGNKWGFFPAAAFRWNIKNEPWMKRTKWLNTLALRVSAGRSGNDAISSYMSIATISPTRTTWMFGDYQALSYYPTRLSNSNLTWETTDSYNVGLNFAALKNRLEIELEGYHTVTSDLLLATKVNQNTGYDTYFTNLGKTSNTGVELTLTTRNIVKRRFTWTTSLTIAHNRQMVMDVGTGKLIGTYYNPRNSNQPMYGYKEGYPVNSLWGYQYAGVWKNEDEISRNETTHTYVGEMAPNPGRSKFVDKNKDGILDRNDLVYLGSSDPIVMGGFQNTFYIGDFTLKAYFSYSVGGKIYNLSELWMSSGTRAYNKYRYMIDAWHPVRNPDGYYPRANYSDSMASDRMVYDGSFLRLKEVSLTYNLKIPQKVKWIRQVRLGVSAENLFLLKNYNGFDPDVSTSSAARRIDNGSFPRPRTFMFNVSLSY